MKKLEITRNLKIHGNYNTSLFSMLKKIEDNDIVLYNNEYDLRHPLSIYLIAYNKIISSINEVLELLNSNEKDVINKYESFLHNVNSFIDEGYNILKCFYAPNCVEKNYIFADKFLEAINSKGIKDYKSNIEPYIKNTRYIVNKIKHEHGRLQQIIVKTDYGYCRGYFLEKYNNGVLESDNKIHKHYKGQSTAFSFILDIMKNIALVYIVSDKLVDYLKQYILPENFCTGMTKYDQNEKIINIVDKIWKLPLIIFPDEYEQNFIIFDIIKDKEQLFIRYPAPIYYFINFKKCTNGTYTLLTHGDGTNKTFRVPYIGGKGI